MTPEERDDLELAGHAIWAFLHTENHGTPDERIRTITRRFRDADHHRGPRHRRPKHARSITALTGLGLALALTGCIPTPADVQIGDPAPAVTYDPVAWAVCTDITGHPFRWWGPASHLPEGCHVIATEPGTPELQAAASAPAITRGSK